MPYQQPNSKTLKDSTGVQENNRGVEKQTGNEDTGSDQRGVTAKGMHATFRLPADRHIQERPAGREYHAVNAVTYASYSTTDDKF
jgi:hypothetical protein